MQNQKSILGRRKLDAMNPSCSILLSSVFIAINGAMGILDGQYAMDNQFIYQVAILTRYKSHICGGGIIDKTHILTAAHCVYDKAAWELSIGAGVVHMRDPDIIFREVTEIYYPEDYVHGVPAPNSTTHLQWEANDIAVLTVHCPFPESDRIGSLTLPFRTVTPCDVGVFAGWGENEPNDAYYEYLQWTYQRILEPNICRELKAYHSADQFCSMTPAGYGEPSDGDDGSPLVINGVVVGIAELIEEAGRTWTRFTSVYDYLDFITEIIVI